MEVSIIVCMDNDGEPIIADALLFEDAEEAVAFFEEFKRRAIKRNRLDDHYEDDEVRWFRRIDGYEQKLFLNLPIQRRSSVERVRAELRELSGED